MVKWKLFFLSKITHKIGGDRNRIFFQFKDKIQCDVEREIRSRDGKIINDQKLSFPLRDDISYRNK